LRGVPDNVVSESPRGSGLPFKMLHDRVLVALRKEDGERRSTGGILIPATAQVSKRLVWGEARGVGAACRQVKVGDQVLFSPDDQHEVEVHGEDLIILRERDVHAVAAERIEESTGLYL
jgi:chaperonin GroES